MNYKYLELKKPDGNNLRGCINYDGNLKDKKPVIIMYHGFTGNRIGRKFFFVQMAEKFVEAGYHVVRFDFAGSGESDGDFIDMTLTSELEDAELIYRYIESLQIDDGLYILGFSMGGLVSSLVAKELKPKKLVLLAPASDMKLLIKPIADKIIGTEMEEKDFEYGGVFVNISFYRDLVNYDPYEAAKEYDGEVSIFRGSVDETVTRESNEKLRDAFPNARYTEIDGTDHSFTNAYARQKLIGKIIDFLK